MYLNNIVPFRLFYFPVFILLIGGCATTTLYKDELGAVNHSHVLIRGIQNILVSNERYYLVSNDHAYLLDCSHDDFEMADRLVIYLDERTELPSAFQLNNGDKYICFGKIKIDKFPELNNWNTIEAEVVSIKFDRIKPKSIYFKLAMTPFAIAFDAALCGGYSSSAIVHDPVSAVSLISAISK